MSGKHDKECCCTECDPPERFPCGCCKHFDTWEDGSVPQQSDCLLRGFQVYRWSSCEQHEPREEGE